MAELIKYKSQAETVGGQEAKINVQSSWGTDWNHEAISAASSNFF